MKTKPDFFYNQSGVIPYRFQDGTLQVLLITSRSGRRWVIPKGIVEPHLTPAVSAAKEALEEAGVEGRLHTTPIGTYRREKWGGICTVEVFLMNVTNVQAAWPEAFRERAWLTVEDASTRVEEEGLAYLLQAAPAFLVSLNRKGND